MSVHDVWNFIVSIWDTQAVQVFIGVFAGMFVRDIIRGSTTKVVENVKEYTHYRRLAKRKN